MDQMYLEIVIDGGEIAVDVINGDGVKCKQLADGFFGLGAVSGYHEKPELNTEQAVSQANKQTT